MASRGLRVLAVASRSIRAASLSPGSDPLPRTSGLTLIGLVGLMDPPRPEARQAIGHRKAAGITVKMITGDHRGTAGAIAGELGLRGDVVDGAELDAWTMSGLPPGSKASPSSPVSRPSTSCESSAL